MAEFLQFLAVTLLLKFIKCSQCVLIKSIISLDKVWRTKSNLRDVDPGLFTCCFGFVSYRNTWSQPICIILRLQRADDVRDLDDLTSSCTWLQWHVQFVTCAPSNLPFADNKTRLHRSAITLNENSRFLSGSLSFKSLAPVINGKSQMPALELGDSISISFTEYEMSRRRCHTCSPNSVLSRDWFSEPVTNQSVGNDRRDPCFVLPSLTKAMCDCDQSQH